MVYRTPSDKEYQQYDGGHCQHLWHALSEDWTCPGCDRSKREILRWDTYYDGDSKAHPQKFIGWRASLLHYGDHIENKRFPMVTACWDCCFANRVVKQKLELPDNFSFSPEEIRQFITPVPNAPHTDKARSIKYDIAATIFDGINDYYEGHYPDFEKNMSQFTYQEIEFKISVKDGNFYYYEQPVSPAYLICGTGIEWAALVVHRLPGEFREDLWYVSEQTTGSEIEVLETTSRDAAAQYAIDKIKALGQDGYQKALARTQAQRAKHWE